MADQAAVAPEVGPSASYREKLRDGEHLWAWKVGLRAALLVIDVIGIGAAGWLTSSLTSNEPYVYDYVGDDSLQAYTLIPLALSFIWCSVCLLVLFLRRPPRPAHPGIAVGLDLILWIAFIITGLLATLAVINLEDFGSDPTYLGDPIYHSGYVGHYHLAANNTWIYNVTSNNASPAYTYNYTSGTYTYAYGNISAIHRTCTPDFPSCQAQDAFVNHLWHSKHTRVDIEILVDVTQWLAVILHFALFVWACVDTNRRNAARRTPTASQIEAAVAAALAAHDKEKRLPKEAAPQESQPVTMSPPGVA